MLACVSVSLSACVCVYVCVCMCLVCAAGEELRRVESRGNAEMDGQRAEFRSSRVAEGLETGLEALSESWGECAEVKYWRSLSHLRGKGEKKALGQRGQIQIKYNPVILGEFEV